MSVEYDLIVIGGSSAGAYAALTAARLNARVALVEPQPLPTTGIADEVIYTHAISHIGRIVKQIGGASQLGIYHTTVDAKEQWPIPSVQLTQAMEWAHSVVETCSEQNSSVVLGYAGVDVITGTGEFCRRPYLGFVVNNRRLKARAYLIATGFRPYVPDIDGLQKVSYFTPADIWQEGLQVDRLQVESLENNIQPGLRPAALTNHRLQGSWLVIGGTPMSIELTQTLARLNYEVTLVTSTAQILPNEDPEASLLVQAQLESEGIRILSESPVTQIRQIEDKIWVQAGNQAIEADKILLATGQQPDVEGLNLEGVGVKYTPQGLELNEKLQTTNPRIYACGDVVGGYTQAHIAQYEASIALKNALFAPLFKVDYRAIPWAIFSDPELARVGMTEAQARLRYGKDVFVVRQYFKTLDKAQILGETTGFCKIVGRENGEILGASIVGPSSSELIGAIAFCIRHKMNVKALADFPHVSPTLSEIVHKTAIEWQRQRQSKNKSLNNFLESFFNLRRNWSS